MTKYTSLVLTTAVSAIALAAVAPAFADTNCESIYGGGQTCGSGNFTVEKQVQKPGTNDFVDNLGTQDPAYQPGAIINFKIIVKNTSNTTLTNVVIQDKIDPTQEFVEFSNTPLVVSNFDTHANIVTYTIPSLGAGQEYDLKIVGTIVPAANLPINTSTVCPTNIVSVSADNNQTTQATSEFCIANPTVTTVPVQVFPPTAVKTNPGTGPETLPLLALIPTAGVGFWLRKKSK